jgi:hypothetical protein
MKMTAAVEHGARMGAMDGATQNAGQLIKKVTLHYNKTRQTAITKELMDIVGGAEALKYQCGMMNFQCSMWKGPSVNVFHSQFII